MKKFILIDQSIKDSGGHYLEYAKRVLRAAKSFGFKTVLGVNRNAEEVVCPDADIIDRAFTRTFWENQAIGRLALAVRYLQKSSMIAGEPRFSRAYAMELQSFFLRIGAGVGDLVFVPTLGGVELIGIALYSVLKNAASLEWHLLFRRDLPKTKGISNGISHINLARTSKSLLEFDKRFEKGSVTFYSDTEELAAQYNQLDAFHFLTLPIPIDDSLSVRKRTGQLPLTVSYLGDAREEKGFHLLPKLIKDLRTAGLGEDRVRFRIQANLPRAGTTARVRNAKDNLTRRQGPGLELLEGPFDSNKYHELITSSDIILVPYCAKSYRARSSGIFAEALAAGVPTIYPRGTWMELCHQDSGSVGFNKARDMASAVIDLVSHYPEYESHSQNFSHVWRQIHSARRLIDSLINRLPEIKAAEEAKLRDKDASGHASCNELFGRNTD
ncbi:MAG: glycosyltransferase family protein [Sulfuricaulis sp.]